MYGRCMVYHATNYEHWFVALWAVGGHHQSRASWRVRCCVFAQRPPLRKSDRRATRYNSPRMHALNFNLKCGSARMPKLALVARIQSIDSPKSVRPMSGLKTVLSNKSSQPISRSLHVRSCNTRLRHISAAGEIR